MAGHFPQLLNPASYGDGELLDFFAGGAGHEQIVLCRLRLRIPAFALHDIAAPRAERGTPVDDQIPRLAAAG